MSPVHAGFRGGRGRLFGCLPGTTVSAVAAGSSHGQELALEWIDSPKPLVASAGWATWSGLVAIKPDEELDLAALKGLLNRVKKTIVKSPGNIRYHMNWFLISAGCYVASLTELAIKIGEELGQLTCDFGNNDCQVFYAPDFIRKVQKRGTIRKKRKTVKC